jgi:hypothetical protein
MSKRDRDESWENWVGEALPGRHLRMPPAGTLRRALALGGGLKSRPSAASWVVELLFDSAAQPLPAGVRGTGAGHRRLLYQARTTPGEEVQLDLRVRREAGGTFELTGQVLPPWSGGRIVARLGKTTRKQPLGDGGEFVVRRLPARAETLTLEISTDAGDELVVPDIPLPEPVE